MLLRCHWQTFFIQFEVSFALEKHFYLLWKLKLLERFAIQL